MTETTTTDRFAAAIEAAELAFWAKIADAFPEIKTGDMDPMAVHRFHEAMESAVGGWLEGNAPVNQISVGSRWELQTDVDRYPYFIGRRGMRGIVTYVSEFGEEIRLKMDGRLPDAEEFDNEIHWNNGTEGCIPAVMCFLRDCARVTDKETR